MKPLIFFVLIGIVMQGSAMILVWLVAFGNYIVSLVGAVVKKFILIVLKHDFPFVIILY